jgi:hypothetical protein
MVLQLLIGFGVLGVVVAQFALNPPKPLLIVSNRLLYGIELFGILAQQSLVGGGLLAHG